MKTALVTSLICTLLPTTVTARSFSWMNGEIHVTTNDIQAPSSNRDCQNRLVRIGSRPTIGLTSVCIYERPSWSYGYYTHKSGPSYAPNYSTKFVVAIGNDSAMYELSGLPRNGIIHTPDYDGLLFDRSISPGIWESRHVTVVKNLPASIERSYDAANKTVSYALESGARTGLIKDSAGNTVTTHAVDVSPSGAKLAIEIKSLGLAVYDLHTGELRVFSDFKSKPWPFVTRLTFAVDPSREYVAVKRDDSYIRVHAPLSSCAISNNQYSDDLIQRVEASDLCDDDGGRTQTALDEELGADRAKRIYNLAFNDEGSAIKGYTSSLNPDFDPDNMDDYTVTEVKILANGYVEQQLEYLALGDSYSSGEGDYYKKGGVSHYTPVTDFKGGCHLSTRSYPFLLRNKWELQGDDMQSVACSGAKIDPDYTASIQNYNGQRGQLNNLDENRKTDLRNRALDVYIPGYAPQLEFVKKYKPRVLTLTGGGNDVGFGEKLKECATSSKTCKYAESGDNKWKASHAYQTRAQFESLKQLYTSIRQVSPDTNVYALGYPSFINPGAGRPCAFDAGKLNNSELRFINQSVNYLNQVISSAAAAAGVQYVDITDSLTGGRLCDIGGEYVTGLLDIGLFNVDDRGQAFHPNAKGHARIAEYVFDDIKRAFSEETVMPDPDDSITAPWPNSYFKDHMLAHENRAGTQIAMLMQNSVSAGNTDRVNVSASTFQPNTTVTSTIYSAPISLGTFTSNDQGGLQADVTLPDSLPAGYHTVELSGKTYSGEPLYLYQQILVEDSDVNDKDGDGILDKFDRCMFIETAFGDKQDDFDRYCSTPNKTPIELSGKTVVDKASATNEVSTEAVEVAVDSYYNTSVVTDTDNEVREASKDSNDRSNENNLLRRTNDIGGDYEWVPYAVAGLALAGSMVITYKFVRRKNARR